MRIFKILNNYMAFTGIRQDRNAVSQLQNDNPYDLNQPNQRRISNAIKELSKVQGEDNINFLLDVSENLRYGTNIDLGGKKSYNDWRAKLNQAAVKAFKNSDKSVQDRVSKRLEKVLTEKRTLSPDEKEIINQRNELLASVDLESLKSIKNSNMRNLKNNLDYFIVSSEVPTSQKLYILKRLNYLMSDEYKINPQLEDKKTQVLAEIVNDIVVDTPESKVPNIKLINQRQHGMCVAISVCRKALAYEDKPNYVDMVLSELDDSDYMQVYDRSQLGKHKKIPIHKADIDYNYAIQRGYRIVDASVMNWMNAADTAGAFNDIVGTYVPFDEKDFGTFADTHIHKDIDEDTAKYQDYYRACKKAKDALASCKISDVKSKYFSSIKNSQLKKDIKDIQQNKNHLHNILKQIAPTLTSEDIQKISNELISLESKNSNEINKIPDNKREFYYIPNEEEEMKIRKIKKFLNEVLPENKNSKVLEEKAQEIYDLTEEIHGNSRSTSKTPVDKYYDSRDLYSAAAAYRTQKAFALEIPEFLAAGMTKFNIPDNETYLINNLRTLSKDIRSKKINPELKEKLFESFGSEITEHIANGETGSKDEILAGVLDEYANNVEMMITDFADDIYNSLLAGNRKISLASQLSAEKETIKTTKDKDYIKNAAEILKVKPEKKAILNQLEKYISKLEAKDCTDKEYFEILNKCGHKSNLMDLKGIFDNAFECIFNNPDTDYITGLNLINGADANADITTTQSIYEMLAKSFNNMSLIIKTLQDSLEITSENGTLLNSADPKYAVLKKLENTGEIPTEKELKDFQNKFDTFDKNRYSDDDTKVKFKDMPKYLTTFTPFEKEALKKYQKNINSWYGSSSRELNDIYRRMRDPLEELSREVGVQKGEYWTRENSSGLMDNQAVKIFEHMTDRPYYMETNTRRGVEKIKNSPYSGSSMTSVSSQRPAMHAQYVVDIKPVNVKYDGTDVIKDVIMHDNTWGIAEHDNIWKDKYGLTRTDYSNEYGGDLGYITDDKYRNGNFAENVIDKKGKTVAKIIPSKEYKKLVPGSSEEYTFQMLEDFILQGVSPLAMSTVKSIKQNILLPSSEYVDDLSNYAKNMTQSEIEAAFTRIETAGQSSRVLYKEFLKKIEGDNTVFNKGIDTLEKYNELKPDDKLRLMCEKVAIIKSYDNIPDINTYHIEVTSAKDIKKLRDKLDKTARDNFDYIIGKSPDTMRYLTERSRKDVYGILKQLFADKGMKFDYGQMVKIVNSMKKPDNKNFDGNIQHTVEIMSEQFEKSLKSKTGRKLSDEEIQQTTTAVKNILEHNAEVTPSDIKYYFNSGRLKHFADWVDRTFAPKTDEEFAEILNNLRNMTTVDFKQKYDSSITETDMGITPYTGYDIVKMIRGGNDSVKNSFINTIFSEAYYKDVEESKIRPYYDLRKFSRNLSSGIYVDGKRSFDDLYSDFYYSLSALTIKKDFDKYKDEAFKKYFAFPAYPLMEISTPESLNESLQTFYDKLCEYMNYIYTYKTQEESLNTLEELKNYIDKLDSSSHLSTAQYNRIVTKLERVLALNKDDETYKENMDRAQDIINSRSKSTELYQKAINDLYSNFKIYERTADNKTMSEAAKITLQNIDMYKRAYIMNLFEPKYQRKGFELLNKWISARSKAERAYEHFKSTETEDSSEMSKIISQQYKDNIQKADEYYNQFKDLFFKHRLLESPEKLLKGYLLLCAKDAKTIGIMPSSTDKNELNEVRESYKDNLKSMLYKADMAELQYQLMDCARNGNLNAVRDAFKNSTLELKNGTVVPLDSDEGLQIIVSPMFAEKNLETAVLFLNQLGLSERVCDMIIRSNPLKSAYKNFDRIQRILKSADSQVKFTKDEYVKLGNFDNDPNYTQIVEDFRQKIIEKINKTSFRASKDIFNAAIDDALKSMKENPDMSKTVILGSNLNLAVSELRNVLKMNIDVLNGPMTSIQMGQDLITKLLFPENSPMIAKAQEYIDEIHKLIDYENNHMRTYPYIGITAG